MQELKSNYNSRSIYYMENRRRFLKRGIEVASLIAVAPLLDLYVWADTCPTPASTAGPYYKPGAPFKNLLREQSSNGIPLNVFGKVIDTSGKPLKDAIIEIWHTNPDGNYDLEGYQYRASIRVNTNGEYNFETFLPGAYGGRAQHIHYQITTPQHDKLITQLYFSSDPMFQGNPEKNYRKDRIITDPSLIRPVIKTDQLGYKVNFPICL
jgi:protocatechuate 3,4-dioxygenase beta subunit